MTIRPNELILNEIWCTRRNTIHLWMSCILCSWLESMTFHDSWKQHHNSLGFECETFCMLRKSGTISITQRVIPFIGHAVNIYVMVAPRSFQRIASLFFFFFFVHRMIYCNALFMPCIVHAIVSALKCLLAISVTYVIHNGITFERWGAYSQSTQNVKLKNLNILLPGIKTKQTWSSGLWTFTISGIISIRGMKYDWDIYV